MTTKRPTVTAKVTTTTATKTSTRSRRTTAAKKEDAKNSACIGKDDTWQMK